MKKTLLLSLILLFVLSGAMLMAQVAINEDGMAPDESAVLDISSTEKGVLLPRMTLAERNAIAAPATGLMVFVSDDNRFYVYNGAGWNKVLAGVDGGWTVSGDDLVSSVAGFVGIGTSSPQTPLHVSGDILLTGTEPKINFLSASGASDRMLIRKNPGIFGEINVLSNHELRLRTNDTDRFIIEGDGDINMVGNQVMNFRIENRSNDPSSPAVGRMWIRTDL